MTKINYSVTTVIGRVILGKLVGDLEVVLLPEVMGVAQVEESSLIRQPLIWGA